MELVEVDIIRLQPLQALVDGFMICLRVARVGLLSSRNQVLPPRPQTFDARMILSRFPRALNQLPMIRSVEPCVSGRGGIA